MRFMCNFSLYICVIYNVGSVKRGMTNFLLMKIPTEGPFRCAETHMCIFLEIN